MSDPLHGKTLEMIVTELEDRFGWEHLGYLIPINILNVPNQIYLPIQLQ